MASTYATLAPDTTAQRILSNAGVQRVPNDLRESLRSLGLSRREIHRRRVLTACMPSHTTR